MQQHGLVSPACKAAAKRSWSLSALPPHHVNSRDAQKYNAGMASPPSSRISPSSSKKQIKKTRRMKPRNSLPGDLAASLLVARRRAVQLADGNRRHWHNLQYSLCRPARPAQMKARRLTLSRPAAAWRSGAGVSGPRRAICRKIILENRRRATAGQWRHQLRCGLEMTRLGQLRIPKSARRAIRAH